MPRTVSATTDAELKAPVTRPHYLVYIGFSTPLYLSSRGDTSWNGQSWQASDIVIQGLSPDKRTGEILIGNTDLSIGQTILSEGIADRVIQIFEVHGPNVDDGELLFDGYGGGCIIDERWAHIRLRWSSQAAMFSPRILACKENGFNHLPPGGTKISWDGAIYTLEVKDGRVS